MGSSTGSELHGNRGCWLFSGERDETAKRKEGPVWEKKKKKPEREKRGPRVGLAPLRSFVQERKTVGEKNVGGKERWKSRERKKKGDRGGNGSACGPEELHVRGKESILTRKRSRGEAVGGGLGGGETQKGRVGRMFLGSARTLAERLKAAKPGREPEGYTGSGVPEKHSRYKGGSGFPCRLEESKGGREQR